MEMKRTYIDSDGLMHQGTLEEIKQHMIAELEDILKEDLGIIESIERIIENIETMEELENIAWEYDFEILETEEEFADTLYNILVNELEYMQKDNDYYMEMLNDIFKKVIAANNLSKL